MDASSFETVLEVHFAELRSKLAAEHGALLGCALQELRLEVNTLHEENSQLLQRLATVLPKPSAQDVCSATSATAEGTKPESSITAKLVPAEPSAMAEPAPPEPSATAESLPSKPSDAVEAERVVCSATADVHLLEPSAAAEPMTSERLEPSAASVSATSASSQVAEPAPPELPVIAGHPLADSVASSGTAPECLAASKADAECQTLEPSDAVPSGRSGSTLGPPPPPAAIGTPTPPTDAPVKLVEGHHTHLNDSSNSLSRRSSTVQSVVQSNDDSVLVRSLSLQIPAQIPGCLQTSHPPRALTLTPRPITDCAESDLYGVLSTHQEGMSANASLNTEPADPDGSTALPLQIENSRHSKQSVQTKQSALSSMTSHPSQVLKGRSEQHDSASSNRPSRDERHGRLLAEFRNLLGTLPDRFKLSGNKLKSGMTSKTNSFRSHASPCASARISSIPPSMRGSSHSMSSRSSRQSSYHSHNASLYYNHPYSLAMQRGTHIPPECLLGPSPNMIATRSHCSTDSLGTLAVIPDGSPMDQHPSWNSSASVEQMALAHMHPSPSFSGSSDRTRGANPLPDLNVGSLYLPHSEVHRPQLSAPRQSLFPAPVSSASFQSTPKPDFSDQTFKFGVLPAWDKAQTPLMAAYTTDICDDLENDSDSDDEEEKQNVEASSRLEKCLMRFTVLPMSTTRVIWDLFGCFFVAYDFVVTPLQFFDPPAWTFMYIFNWIARIFWSFDLPFSFMTAYSLPEGTVECRPFRIWTRYASTWMGFDVTIICFDWIDLILQSEQGLGAARVGKTMKITRLLRMVRLVRLIRLIKMPDMLSHVTYHLQTERFVIVVGIIKIMIFLTAVAHLIACCWYGIGTTDESTNWIKRYDIDETNLEYKYTTSFHWSLTQFTGSMEIQPQNFAERFFTVLSLLFGFLVSASVVSTITSSMTRLQIVSARQSTQVSVLNQYLLDNGISTKVALRVQRNAVYAVSQEKRNTPEDSIELLKLVSEPLRIELHYEIHSPILTWYPFFRHYNLANIRGMKRVCHAAVARLSLSRGDVLFSAGEMPPMPVMYFVCAGKLQYQRQGHMPELVFSGQRVCECVLWTVWVHCGVLRAKSESNLMVLDAAQFQATSVQYQTNECYPKRFAHAFVHELNKVDRNYLSDLEDTGFNVEDICDKVFKIHRRKGSVLPELAHNS